VDARTNPSIPPDASFAVNLLDQERAEDDVADARRSGARPLVYLHWGVDYYDYPAAWQVRFARRLVDAGAAIVCGTHAHAVQGWESYGAGVILYGLGNACIGRESAVANYRLTRRFLAPVISVTAKRASLQHVFVCRRSRDGRRVAHAHPSERHRVARLSMPLRLSTNAYRRFAAWRQPYWSVVEWPLRRLSDDDEPLAARLARIRPRHFTTALRGLVPGQAVSASLSDDRSSDSPRICVVDSFPPAGAAAALPTQGQLLARHFELEGLPVLRTSEQANKALRLADIVATLTSRRSAYDVAVVQAFGRRGLVYAATAVRVAAALGKCVVVVLRGGTIPSETSRPALRRMLRDAHIVVAPSPHVAEAVRDLRGDVRVIPNFIEIAEYPFVHRQRVSPRLMWVRAFHEQYNPQLAIRVLHRVRRDHPDATLTMGGPDRGELGACRALAESLGVADAVAFPGMLSKADLIRLSAAHSIHLHTNRIDNMPITVLEHMALGLPVVATRVGGIPHLVRHEETGLLAESDDAEGLSAAIHTLLTHDDLCDRLSAAARDDVARRCSWSGIRQAWLDVLGVRVPAAVAR
jgi:glycosyltransferase involved in cell wall biosynthesis